MSNGTSLIGARPEIIQAVDALHVIAGQRGISFRIADYGGLRTQADTAVILQYRAQDFAKAVRNGEISSTTDINVWRPIAPWGKSMHNYGAAFDVIVTGKPDDMSGLEALNYLKDQSAKLGLVDGRTFGDGPHFELPGGLEAAKAAWQKQTGTSFFDGAVTASGATTVIAIVVFALLAYFLVVRRS